MSLADRGSPLPSRLRARRPCHHRAIHGSPDRSRADNHGQHHNGGDLHRSPFPKVTIPSDLALQAGGRGSSPIISTIRGQPLAALVRRVAGRVLVPRRWFRLLRSGRPDRRSPARAEPQWPGRSCAWRISWVCCSSSASAPSWPASTPPQAECPPHARAAIAARRRVSQGP
jgi:hypothetical protein